MYLSPNTCFSPTIMSEICFFLGLFRVQVLFPSDPFFKAVDRRKRLPDIHPGLSRRNLKKAGRPTLFSFAGNMFVIEYVYHVLLSGLSVQSRSCCELQTALTRPASTNVGLLLFVLHTQSTSCLHFLTKCRTIPYKGQSFSAGWISRLSVPKQVPFSSDSSMDERKNEESSAPSGLYVDEKGHLFEHTIIQSCRLRL